VTVHVLVATDGNLDVATTSRFAAALAGSEGKVTVVTVVEIPRRLLADLRSVMGQHQPIEADADSEYVGVMGTDTTTPRSWPGDDAVITRYLDDKCAQYAQPLAASLRRLGLAAEGIVVESEHVADAIMEKANEVGADVVVVGSHGLGPLHGMLGSVETKLVRRCSLPVLLIRV
jgi:nucleotide-binding universal stress UspA family protein